MAKHRSFILKSVAFLLILAFLLTQLTLLLEYKEYFSSAWPGYSNVRSFYETRRNSIDVLFLGSSHCMTSFIPQEIYDCYGIRTYNLSTTEQSMLVSYYLLKEALRYQSPRAVVLETRFCHEYPSGEAPFNSKEFRVRSAVDPMRWSPVKMEAVADICSRDENHKISSYFNPLERFHGRWPMLNEDDFTWRERLSHDELKGYSMKSQRCYDEDYEPFDADPSAGNEEMMPLMEEYVDKIVYLCAKKDIPLILVKAPSGHQSVERSNCLASYAQDNGIAFYDFNSRDLYTEIGYEFALDNMDNEGHLNLYGAQKVSRKIGQILAEEYGIPASHDDQWEDSRGFYEAAKQNVQLSYVTDLQEYLDSIRGKDYSIFIAVKDEASSAFTDEAAECLRNLGLEADLREAYRSSYYAVITPDNIREELSNEELTASGSIRGGRCLYQVSSAGYECGDDCSIVIDGTEYAQNSRGLNIVVYDNLYRKVIDSVAFDTFDPSIEASR